MAPEILSLVSREHRNYHIIIGEIYRDYYTELQGPLYLPYLFQASAFLLFRFMDRTLHQMAADEGPFEETDPVGKQGGMEFYACLREGN